MFVDPNIPINTRVWTILLYQGKISFTTGETISMSDLSSGNKLEDLCKSLNPNIDYIDILMPDDIGDRNDFYEVRRKCGEYNGIHAQSTIRTTESVLRYWEQLVQADEDNQKTKII